MILYTRMTYHENIFRSLSKSLKYFLIRTACNDILVMQSQLNDLFKMLLSLRYAS